MRGPIYTTADIRRIEQAAGTAPLMERAGTAAAELAAKLCDGKDVLVLAGPGNNGGDARIAAKLLEQRFFRVTVAGKEIPPEKAWGLVIDGLFGIGLARHRVLHRSIERGQRIVGRLLRVRGPLALRHRRFDRRNRYLHFERGLRLLCRERFDLGADLADLRGDPLLVVAGKLQ